MAKASVEHKRSDKPLRDLPGTSAGRSLSPAEADELRRHLTAPAVMARWIEAFAPNVRRRKAINIAIASAGHDAVMRDRGRWHQFIPSLLGISGMKVTVALVGKELVADSSLLAETAMASAVATLPAASIHGCTIGEYLDASRWQPDPDLVFLFHSASAEDASSWPESDIRTVLETGMLVGACAPAEAKTVLDSRLLSAYGYSAERRTFTDPFASGKEVEDDRSGHALWKFAGGTGPTA